MASGKSENQYSEKIITPIGRLSYPHVFERGISLDKGKEGKYEVTLLIPKSTDISVLRKAIEEVGAKAFGAKWKGNDKQVYPTIKDGDEKEDPVCKGHWILRAKTDNRPGVVDAQLRPIEAKEEIYGGCWARLSIKFGSYVTLGNTGVTAYLLNLMKVRDDEAFGGGRSKPEDDFAGFASAQSAAVVEETAENF